jgi:hypothetical protein
VAAQLVASRVALSSTELVSYDDCFCSRDSVVDWIRLAQDMYRWRALMNAVMNLRVP